MGLAAAVLIATLAAEPGASTEIGFVPLVGGDTDIGIGGGFLLGVAGVAPDVKPYRWRLESAAFFSFKKPSGRGLVAPYQDAFIGATIPGLFGGRARLELRPSFTRETNLRYYGVGNASVAPENEVPARDFYRRTHPTMAARLRVELGGGLFALAGTSYTYNWIDYDADSRLAMDVRADEPRLRGLLDVQRRFGIHLVETGLGFDRRDDEVAPTRGQFHQLKLRTSTGGFSRQPYQYLQLGLVTRGYLPLGDRVVAAARLVGDALLGDVPFYELGRFAEDASAIGGANGVRGVPADRYLGRWKAFGNVEVRVRLARFTIAGSPYTLGAAGFFDGGRVWADGRDRALDGGGVGLKYGTGGGLRVQKGQTFVIRADVAWSPDARPLGGYFLAGHIF